MSKNQTKFIFVTGGVISGLGKGISSASIANLLKARGLKVNLQKCDPYLNVDAGLLNPREHGECFVTKDGAETDLDLGHYERFTDEELTQSSSVMSGRVLLKVIQDERRGKYDGDDVQIIPHLTSAIQKYIQLAGGGFDVHLVEIGGTVGDYESLSFLEAIRELGLIVGKKNCLYVHLVYLPYLSASNEIKTKPAQNSVRDLRGLGIQPDIIFARSEKPTNDNVINKLSLFTGVSKERIIPLPNAYSIYEVPLTLEKSGIVNEIVKSLNLKVKKPNLSNWREMVKLATSSFERQVKIAVIAKYLDNTDTYMSVFEALRASALWKKANLDIVWIDSEELEKKPELINKLSTYDGILVPGGFGKRGLEGKILAANYALDKKLPYLGLCLGLQMAVIALARRAGLSKATTFELDPNSKFKVITTMNDQAGKENTGGTMRLGNYNCILKKGSLAYSLYKRDKIVERHRHRGECNDEYLKYFDKWGIVASGMNPDNNLVEIIEAKNHPFFLASQFHPEFKSRPTKPHPMFDGFIEAVLAKKYK